MGTISANDISGALARAKSIGIVEDDFVIQDTALVLRNLTPDEYSESMEECAGLEAVAYLNAYQKGHLSRSIVEINGVDLREVDYVEVEEPDPKDPTTPKVVKLEKHSYLKKTLLDTWGKEVVYAVYQKFNDVVAKAEKQALDGLTFLVPDETPDQQYRRLMGDLKEIEGDVPSELLAEILEDVGFMKKSTAAELKAAMVRTDELAREQEAAKQAASPPVVKSPVKQSPPQPTVEDQKLMAEREPLNREPGQRAVDPHQTLQDAIKARQQPEAQPSAEQPQQPVQAPLEVPPGEVKAASRAAKIAALEGDAGIPMEGTELQLPAVPEEVAVLTGTKQENKLDPKALTEILDRPPVAGINPRYKPPAKV